ncbi:hypothetical protein LXA43DRAFT_1024090 [Ganoderma leucocontextum]|nr:hypothetical protein LXA43DRAFT_1024090 [Ganoderma leucocontextum]
MHNGTIHMAAHRYLRYAFATRGCLRKYDLPMGASLVSPRRFTHFSAYTHHPLDLDMPPDYELQSYWNARFENESHFEWLGDGSDTILPHLRSHLLDPRLYRDVYGPQADERAIVNVDFAEKLVAKEREKEVGGSRTGMQWICADALKWRELEAALDLGGEGRTFDLVVDKSTSDAISCAEDVSYSSPDPSLHPVLKEILAAQEGRKLSIPPVELLAVHLALWVALTFSSNRFPFLSCSGQRADASPLRAARYWDVERVITIDAPTGMEGSAYAPVVQHYVFLIRRKDT